MKSNTKKLLAVLIILLIIYITELIYNYYKSIIITVNGINITKSQFDKEFNQMGNTSGFLSLGIDLKNNKNNFLYQIVKDKTINSLINQILLDSQIQKKHITVSDNELNSALERIIKVGGSKEGLINTLKQNGTSLAQFKKDLRESLKKKKLAESISKISITDKEAEKYYQQNLDKFKHDSTAKISQIFVFDNAKQFEQEIKADVVNKNLSDKEIQAKVKQEEAVKFKKIKNLLALVKKNPDSFSEVAKENSEDKIAAKKGGNWGYLSRKQLSPILAQEAFSIKLNTVSNIIKTPHGYHILIVSDRTQDNVDSFAKVKDQIVFTLEKQKQDEILNNLAKSLEKQAKIKYVNPYYKPNSMNIDKTNINKN